MSALPLRVDVRQRSVQKRSRGKPGDHHSSVKRALVSHLLRAAFAAGTAAMAAANR